MEIPRRIIMLLARATRATDVAGGSSVPTDIPTSSLISNLSHACFEDGPWPADVLIISSSGSVSIELDPKHPIHYADTEIGRDD